MQSYTEKTVREVISAQLGINPDVVTPDKYVAEDLGADLVDLVEIMMTLEDRFDVVISEDDAEGLTTVGKIVDFLEEREKTK